MKIDYAPGVIDALDEAPTQIRNAFFKQAKLLQLNLRHPSLHAKKYDQSQDLWQARVTKGWRFFFKIKDDTYVIVRIIPHPK